MRGVSLKSNVRNAFQFVIKKRRNGERVVFASNKEYPLELPTTYGRGTLSSPSTGTWRNGRSVSNTCALRAQAVEFSWDPEETGIENPLYSSGVVSIQPATGRIGAAQSVLFRVTISAECGPRFLGQQPMACLVKQEPPTTVGAVFWFRYYGKGREKAQGYRPAQGREAIPRRFARFSLELDPETF